MSRQLQFQWTVKKKLPSDGKTGTVTTLPHICHEMLTLSIANTYVLVPQVGDVLLKHSHSMKNGLETRQSQRTSVLSFIITWEVFAKNDCALLL